MAIAEDRLQYLLDRLDIEDVIARYSIGQDAHQGDDHQILREWNDVFTEDAELDYSSAGFDFTRMSHRDMAKLMRGETGKPGFMNSHFAKWLHLIGHPTVTIKGDTASARTDMLALHTAKQGSAQPFQLIGACIFYDELVRTAGGWRIRRRRLETVFTDIFETVQHRKSLTELVGA